MKVSVIIPVYNCRRFLEECVFNVLGQSFQDFEILLIDDGSTDGSSEVCEQVAERDTRIHVFHTENRGVASARNRGIQEARGEFIAFLDADDWWNCEFLSKMLEAVATGKEPFCHLIKVTSDNKEHVVPTLDFNSSPTGNIIACWRGLYSRRVLDNKGIRFTEGLRTGEDQEFVYKYLLHCEKCFYVSDAIYYYRINPSSCMFKKNYAHFDAVEALKNAANYARLHGTAEQAAVYERDLIRYNAVRTIEFASLTLLTAGELWKAIYDYLKGHSYDELIEGAIATGDYYHSRFYDLWKKSPVFCLRFFALKKNLGRAIRSIQFWK